MQKFKWMLLVAIKLPLFSSELPTPHVFAVVGMHRSGTSLISSCLSDAGIDFGDRLLGPDANNPFGYYEDIDIGRFNETALFLQKLECHSICKHPNHFNEKSEIIAYGCQLLMSKASGKKCLGFKDPRTARNMHLWKKIFDLYGAEHISLIIIFRHPDSVAQSLAKRNGLGKHRV